MKLPEPPFLRELNRDDPQECNLVLNSWLRSYTESRQGGAESAHVPKNVAAGVEASVFHRIYAPVVKDLLARCRVLCAVDPAEDTVYGWMAWEGDVLQYVCVKRKWHRLGIATWMLRDFHGLPVTYSHRTTDWLRLRDSMVEATSMWTYKPLARFKEAA